MGIGDFLSDIGNGITHGLNKTVEGLNVVDRYINPFHQEQTLTPEGQLNARKAAASGQPQSQGVLVPSLEDTLSGMRWLYSNGVSQPISTAALVGKMNRGNNSFFGGDYFNTNAWTKAWHAANHISPGQALFLNPDEADQAINSKLLYYKPPEAYLPPEFNKLPEDQQQDLLRDAGMPAIGNRFIEKMRGNSGWYKYGSGAVDFASVTFADPTVLAGNLISGTRKLMQVHEMPKAGWSQASIDQLISKSKMQTLMKGIWENRDNPQLLNNTALAQHSGMGPRFGSIVSKLQDPDELELFIRTGMGDMRAVDELSLRNAQAALRINSDTNRLAALDLMRSRYASQPNMLALVENQMKQANQRIASDVDLVSRYDSIVDQQGLLDQLHVSRWSLQRAADKTQAQNAYRAGPAIGGKRPVTIQPTTPPLTYTRQDPRPAVNGYVHSTLWGKGDYFSGPVTMIRSLKNYHPNGYMQIDSIDRDSVNELRGHLARIPNIKESTRADIVNKYLKTTTEAERKDLLDDVGRLGAAKVAQRYGLDPKVGEDLYRQHQKLRLGEIDNMERYSAALRDQADVAAGQPLHIDEFTADGGKVTLSPFLVTQLINGHTFQDLDELGKVLARHGSKFETLRLAAGKGRDWLEGAADYTSYLWKFSTLFRLGYIPRVMGDDLASQWARAGTAAMALRAMHGLGNAAHNIALTQTRPALQWREANARFGAEYAADELKNLAPQQRKLEGFLAAEKQSRQLDLTRAQRLHAASQARMAALNPGDVSAKARAVRTLHGQRVQQLKQAQLRAASPVSPGKTIALADMRARAGFLERYHGLQTQAADDYLKQQQKVIQGNQAIDIDGHTFPAAFEGKSGEYHYKLISADESVGNIFATNKQLMQGNLERSFSHGAKPISAAQDEVEHAKAWAHAINNQIMQDPLSVQLVKGDTAEKMTKWLSEDPRGIAYRRRLPKFLRNEDIAQSAKYQVDQYLHTPEIRMKALTPEGVTPDFLKKATPNLADRPDVHIGQVGQSQLSHAKALDRVIEKWYGFAATLPANRMSRHPLFNQFYEGHLARMFNQRKLQGMGGHMTVDEIESMAHSARRLALRDTRSLVFDIAHRSDAAAALRFISPFFSATAEAFQRWGRVIADKPQIVGYMGNWYNAPAYTGHTQDANGNRVDGEGYAYVPTYPLKADGTPDYSKKPTITKTKVAKGDRYIVTRVPKWFANSPAGKAFNVTEAGGKLAISQNSVNMLTQGDPWYNPGVGPIVQIPVNEFVRDKPRAAEMAREFGILPFGVQGGTLLGENPFGRAVTIATPAAFRNFITAYDTSDQRYQQIKLQIMQREIFDFENSHGGRMPTQREIGAMQQKIADKTRDYWLFSASSSFLQPFATQRKDPFQFYRDQYNALRNQNPLTADDQFLQRYGQSYFIFAQEITKSAGIQPTMKAVDLARKYGKEIAQNPELAALIIGPEGNGPFSPEAYQYELNNPLVPGSPEMMRGKITADQAVKENQRRLGWAKYAKKMNQLGAQLRAAGFTSYEDDGAEDFKDQKKAWTSLYAEPLYPDGTINPYYNEEWSKDFFTQDNRKYERMIPALTVIARSDLAKLPQRSDLRTLQQYLGGRQALQAQLYSLQQQGLPHTLNAQDNAGLRAQWATFVDGLIEADTRFGDLYHRYLSRDMGVNALEEANQ